MYAQIDGILACRDLRSAGGNGFRGPYVPLHVVQDCPKYLNMGLMYLNLALCTPT